jgi:hypothetical protein
MTQCNKEGLSEHKEEWGDPNPILYFRSLLERMVGLQFRTEMYRSNTASTDVLHILLYLLRTEETNSAASWPQANYTDGVTATGWQILLKTFVNSGVWHSLRGGPSQPLISIFQTRATTFYVKQLLIYPRKTEWTPFQTQCYSEKCGSAGIEPGTSGSAARNAGQETTEAVHYSYLLQLQCY